MKSIYKLVSPVALSVIVGLITSCGRETGEVSNKSVSNNIVTLSEAQYKNAGIRTGGIAIKEIPGVLRVNGRIDVPPQNMISISIPLGGYLKSTSMLPGTHVNKGQVIAVMEDSQYIQLQQDYLIASSRMEYAEQEQQRQKQLNEGKAGSDKVLQLAEAEFKSLRISTGALAEKLRLIGIDPVRLNERTISRQIVVRSPINGFISKVNGNIGSYVNPSDVLFELVNPKDIHLNLMVFERDLDKLSIGQKAIAYTNNDTEKKYNTEIILISRDLSADHSAEVHCHFEKYDSKLVPGMYMNAEISISNNNEAILPENSVVSFGGKQYVFIERGRFTYEIKEISTGNIQDGFISIKTDLGKEKIVTNGAYSLLMQLKNVPEE